MNPEKQNTDSRSDRTGPERFDDWARRNDHWLRVATKRTYRRKRQSKAEPLILCGHGMSLTVDRAALVVRNGLTHFPQEREELRFFKGDRSLPSRIIILDGSGSLSFAVLSWLAQQGVSLFKIDYQGGLVSVLAGGGCAYDPERVRWQMQTRDDHNLRLEFCCELIQQKIRGSLKTLREALPDSRARVVAVAAAEVAIHRLSARNAETVEAVRLIEARAAAAYFQAWRAMPIRWKSIARHPVPENWHSVESRRSMGRLFATNRRATHPVNAMLNYAYAALHSRVQTEAIAEGYDPARGIMHESRSDASAMVLDLIEPRRPLADAAVLNFIAKSTFSGADFSVTNEGVCRLSPQLARRVAALVD